MICVENGTRQVLVLKIICFTLNLQRTRPPGRGPRLSPICILRESGIQAAETVIAGAAAGAAAATRSVTENQTMLALRGDWLDRTLRIPRQPPGLAPPPDEVPAPQSIGRPSEVEPLLERAGQRAAEVERQAAQDIESFASQQLAEAEASEGFATAAEAAAGAAEAAAAAEAGGGALALLGEGALATAGAVGAATGGLAVAGAGAALVGTAWAIEGGLNAASHLMGWGAATGGGTDSDTSRPSMTTDVQTLNGTQESGAVDHYFIQEQRRGVQDRHGVGERAQESAAATDPKPPGTAPEAPGADPFRPEQRSHPRVLRQRTVPGQPPVPRRPGTPWNPAVLRGASSGERTGSCVSM